jgi:hypothetical protein
MIVRRLSITLTLIIIATSALAGCDRIVPQEEASDIAFAERGRMAMKATGTAPDAMPAPRMAAPASPNMKQRLMRTASIRVEVRDVDRAGERARELVEGMGGHVARSSAYEDNAGIRELRLTLKVPADKLDEALDGLKDLGRVRAEDISARDVTEEYFDLETRLANAKKLEKRLIQLLETKTKELKDLLDTEKELARVRENIERMEGRKRYMDSRISLATIEATFTQPRGFGRGIFEPLSGIFQRSLGALTASIAALIVVVSAALPWLIVLVLVGWVMIRLLKAYLKHKREKRKKQ